MTPSGAGDADLQGASAETVRAALADGDPLPGAAGFAGQVDGSLVRDVLGRYPLFVDAATQDDWAFDRTALADPQPVPAGHVRDDTGTRAAWSLPDPTPVGHEGEAVSAVREAIEASLETVHLDGLAIAFSGGVDSAILAASLDAPLYVAGFPDSHDVEAATSAAALLDRPLTVVDLDHETITDAIPSVVEATGRTNAMDVAIALTPYCLAERLAEDGYDRLALGQGADELFGGYAKVAKAPEDSRVDAETVRGARREVVASLPDQLERDVLTIRAAGLEPVVPLLHDSVVEAALRLPGDLLVTPDAERKRALRLAASNWVPDEIAHRDKKAMQYGSLVSRELDRLARQAGFKRRMDDHVRQYVESLVE
jgi:asparagine synthase (glutamine-hydrolysing)